MRRRTVVRLGSVILTTLLVGAGAMAPANAVITTEDIDTGSIAGRLTDQHGDGVPDADVWAEGDGTGFFEATVTDADGFYRLDELEPDLYRVRFEPLGAPGQYAFGKTSFHEADLIPVVAGQESVVDDQLLPTGTITGQVLDSEGAPASVSVFAEPVEGGSFGSVATDEDGFFSLEVAPGEYRVGFFLGSGLTQYAFGTFEFFDAEIFEVGPGETVVVNDQLLPNGTITGRLTDRDGNGVAFASVSAEPDDGGSFASGFTDEDGDFTIQVAPGRYRVLFDVDGFGQYAFGTARFSQAEIFDVAAGETVTVNDTLIATGTVTGRFTDQDGTGMEGVNVTLVTLDESLPSQFASTDEDGFFTFPTVVPGDYHVLFESFDLGFQQYAFGVVEQSEAAVITVVADETVTVDDTRLPTGSVLVRARDAATGEPVLEFFAELGLRIEGTSTGELLFPDVPVGTHRITFAFAEGYSYRDVTEVTVVADEQTEVTLTFHPKARVETTVVDAVTGEPVEGVCLIPATSTSFVLPEFCPHVSGPAGEVMVEIERGGSYQFLAWPRDAEGYGAQWLSHNGGTGSQLAAARVTVPEGGVATAPVVRMDLAGSITGEVTQPDGTPVTFGTVRIGNDGFNIGGGLGGTDIDQGRYTLEHLGPYQWPLLFEGFDLPAQWSGGAVTRHTAEKVAVVSGTTSTYDYQVREGAAVTISMDPVGEAIFAVALNARTGDRVAAWFLDPSAGSSTRPVLGPQRVKFVLHGGQGSAFLGGDDFESASTFMIRPHAEQTLILH
jgi:hypothetical protein